jgi:hypothetical protein
MVKFFLFAFALCLSVSSQGNSSSSVKLEYPSNQPVEYVFTHTLEASQVLPGLKFKGKAIQSIQATLTVNSQNNQPLLENPPFEAVFTLQNLKIDLFINDESTSFDLKNPESSSPVSLAEAAQLLNRPIPFRIDNNRLIVHSSGELNRILRQMTLLEDVDFQFLLETLIHPIFALSGKELYVGAKFSEKCPDGSCGVLPSTIDSAVTVINDKEVQAIFQGKSENKDISLKGKLGLNDPIGESIELVLGSTLQGKISWGRENALFCIADIFLEHKGVLKIGSWEWPLSTILKAKIQAKIPSITRNEENSSHGNTSP